MIDGDDRGEVIARDEPEGIFFCFDFGVGNRIPLTWVYIWLFEIIPWKTNFVSSVCKTSLVLL